MKRLIVLLLIAVCSVSLFARKGLDFYNAEEALNLSIPIIYTFSEEIFPGDVVTLPYESNGTSLRQPVRMQIDTYDTIRINDLSTGANSGTVNVTANFYNLVTFKKEVLDNRGISINVYPEEPRLIFQAPITLGAGYIITPNIYERLDFTVAPKNHVTVNVTLNIQVYDADGTR